MAFLDEFEELEQFNPISFSDIDSNPGTPSLSISIHQQFCRLSIIMDRILSSLYAAKSSNNTQEELFREAKSLQLEIEKWYDTSPQSLALNDPTPRKMVPLPHILSL
jgi:hypothetical protein